MEEQHIMVDGVCLKLKNDRTEYICNEKWTKDNVGSEYLTLVKKQLLEIIVMQP